jgi:NAD(P)-dependent dehydrogenase (short-subunit alcohol dehydrogenase family)
MNFQGKRVLVTGSTLGIGRGTAESFLEAGATVAINGRKDEAVARAVRELGSARALAVAGDLGTVAGCEQVVDRAIDLLGGLDVLVNNVGICPLSYMMDVTEEHWDQVIAVNLRSAFFCSKFALPALRKSRGNIVMVASVAGICSGPTDSFVYAISKGGLVNMTRGLAIELAPDAVRVNAVCPGYINTPMISAENAATGGQVYAFIRNATPMRRLGSVRECASSILYFASDLAGYCTGSILVNDGGCIAGGSWGGANAAAPAAAPPAPYVPTPNRRTER